MELGRFRYLVDATLDTYHPLSMVHHIPFYLITLRNPPATLTLPIYTRFHVPVSQQFQNRDSGHQTPPPVTI
jgi:hypothetical protein